MDSIFISELYLYHEYSIVIGWKENRLMHR